MTCETFWTAARTSSSLLKSMIRVSTSPPTNRKKSSGNWRPNAITFIPSRLRDRTALRPIKLFAPKTPTASFGNIGYTFELAGRTKQLSQHCSEVGAFASVAQLISVAVRGNGQPPPLAYRIGGNPRRSSPARACCCECEDPPLNTGCPQHWRSARGRLQRNSEERGRALIEPVGPQRRLAKCEYEMKLAETGRQANIAAAFASNAYEQMDSLFLKISWGGAADLHTFGDILSRAYSYNAHLRQSGLAKGSVIAIVLKHSAELYTAFLGAMMAGLVPTILPFPTPKQDPEKHWTSHRDLFDLSGIAAVFTYPENIPGIERYLSAQVGYLATPQDVDLTNMDARIEDGELAVLQHSSGTTSLKKGVMLTHTAILNQVRSYSAVLGFDSRSRIVSWLPLYHDMGFIACFLMPMVIGSPVSHLDAFAWSAKPTLLLDEIEAFRGEYVWIPNFAYNHIANNVRPNRQWDLRSLKSLINCSEPCKPSTFETFRAISGIRNLSANALQVCYAMAENVFAVSQTDPHSTPRVICVSNHSFRERDRIEIVDDTHADRVEILSCGKVIDGTVARIIDQNGCP